MKKLLIAATLLVATSALATNLATVNGETVTSDDLVAAFVARHSGHAKFLGGEIEARRFLDILIDERLIVQEAYNLGIDEEQDVVARVADFEARKASDYLVWQEIEEKARPTPEQVREVWTRDLGFYVQARQIVVATRAEAEEIREGLLHGGDVEFFARTCSAADSRRNGGAIVAAWGNFTPEWERVVFALKPGELSPVIETRDGFELVLVDDRVETKPPEFEKISQQIESTLRQRGLEERKRVFSDELWTKYHATMQLTDFTNPGAIVATWDGGGSMALKDALTRGELHMLSRLPPRRARFEIESRIRASVNGPLVALEAKARKTADDPTVAKAIDKYREAAMQTVLFREHIYRDATVTDDEARAY
ncbi:MAG TPA: peptidylprolyl isomerase, partial [Thermoanaerobaculia bacterium]|nr:peptidylprolyl isomerase [Thermoanaerobaculia bacterium]